MAWVKLTDKVHDNDKLGGVSDAAFRLWVLAIAWSNDRLSDGHIPSSRPVRLLSMRKPEKTIAELLDAKLWHRASAPCASCVKQRAEVKADPIPSGGYVIHHYFGDPETGARYQKTRWVIEAEREDLRRRGRLGGLTSGVARSGQVKPPASEIEGVGEADGSSRSSSHGSSRSSSSQLKPPAKQPGEAAGSTPVPPYSRSPESDSSRTSRARAGDPLDPEPVDEPEEPPRPARPRATGSVDPEVRGRARPGGGLRHIGEALGGGAR